MPETKNIIFGIIGVLILGGSGVYLLTPEQLDKAYTCTTNNITGIFESFSKTNVTAYWKIDGVQKQSVCTKGKWIPTTEWLKINNLEAKDITLNQVEESEYTEDNIKIIAAGEAIVVNESKQISIEGTVYNISYVEKPARIKCICDKITGCQVSECLG